MKSRIMHVASTGEISACKILIRTPEAKKSLGEITRKTTIGNGEQPSKMLSPFEGDTA
jgi:hypothetical protein